MVAEDEKANEEWYHDIRNKMDNCECRKVGGEKCQRCYRLLSSLYRLQGNYIAAEYWLNH